MSYLIVTFIKEKRDTEYWRLPQCGCGKLARQYYEIADSEDVKHEISPMVVRVMCKRCFEKMIRKHEGIFHHRENVS